MKKGTVRICFVVLLVSLLLTLTACSPARKLIGTWKRTVSMDTAAGVEVKTEVSYTFNKDGTGYIENNMIERNNHATYDFTYDVIDKSTIEITIDVMHNYFHFSINGDTPTLTNGDLQAEYIKQK